MGALAEYADDALLLDLPIVHREGGAESAGIEGRRLEHSTDRPGGRGFRLQVGVARAPSGGNKTLGASVEAGDAARAQIGLAADIIGPRIAACDDRCLGLLEVRRAEALRPRAADSPAIEEVPSGGHLGFRDAAEIRIMLVAARQL